MTESTENLTSAPTPAPQPAPRRGRTLLIAGGAALAAALLAGGGVAAGAALADDDRDDRDLVAHRDIGARGDDGYRGVGVVGATSAAQLLDIIDAASVEADGVAVDIEILRGGQWDVQFETAAGDESEVRVEADGTTRVVSTDRADADDAAPSVQLDAATVEALVAAALNTAQGTITDLSVDDDPVSPYEVSVMTDDGRTIDIELGPDFTPVRTEVDD